MSRTECPGLDGANPLHFLASLGILRLLPASSRMGWAFSGVWSPWYEAECGGEGFFKNLSRGIRRGIEDHPFISLITRRDGSVDRNQTDQDDLTLVQDAYGFLPKSEIPKMKSPVFREAGIRALERMETIHEPSHPAWILAGLNAESVPDKNGLLEPTAFSFSNGGGQQFLLKDFLSLVSLTTPEAVRCSLLGEPGRFLWCTSLNWDPMALRSYAHQWTEPESMPKETDVAANALAFLGLGCLPVVPGPHGNLTVGFRAEGRTFRWPLWGKGLFLETVGSLLSQDLSVQEEAADRGVSAVFEAKRFSSNKRLYFSPSRSL